MAAHRARLLTAVATLACLWVHGVALLQVCDLWFDHLTGYGAPGFEGTCSLHIIRRKNDTQRRKGHWQAFGRSIDLRMDIVQQSRAWIQFAGLASLSDCSQGLRLARSALLLPSFFHSRAVGHGGSRWLRRTLARDGKPTTRSGGLSRRPVATPRVCRASPRAMGVSRVRSMSRYARRSCTCRMGTGWGGLPAHTCTCSSPLASWKRSRLSNFDWCA